MHSHRYNTEDTIAALATAAGMGAIAVLRLSGPEAFAICDSIFSGKKISKQPSHTIHFGRIQDDGKEIDEVLISIFKGPNSYTGEDVAEISCHGSVFIQQQILDLLVKKGARLAGIFLRRTSARRVQGQGHGRQSPRRTAGDAAGIPHRP